MFDSLEEKVVCVQSWAAPPPSTSVLWANGSHPSPRSANTSGETWLEDTGHNTLLWLVQIMSIVARWTMIGQLPSILFSDWFGGGVLWPGELWLVDGHNTCLWLVHWISIVARWAVIGLMATILVSDWCRARRLTRRWSSTTPSWTGGCWTDSIGCTRWTSYSSTTPPTASTVT